MLSSVKLKQYEYNLFGRSENKFIKTCSKISKIKSIEAAEILADVLENKPTFSFSEKKALIDAFANLGNLSVEVLKKRILINDEINYIAVNSLANIADPETASDFIDLFNKTEDVCFINALSFIDTEETVNFLKSIINNRKSRFRAEAVAVLVNKSFDKDKEYFTKLLDDFDFSVRKNVSKSFNKEEEIELQIKKVFAAAEWDSEIFYKNEDLSKEILSFHITDSDILVRENILNILSNFDKVPDEYISFLYDSVPEIRTAAVKRLSKERKYFENIVFLLTDENSEVRNTVEKSILDNKIDCLPILLQYLQKSDYNKEELYLITTVQDILIKIGDAAIKEVNILLKSKPDNDLLMRLLPVAGESGNDKTASILSDLINSSETDAVPELIWAIGSTGSSDENCELLLDYVDYKDEDISDAAIDAFIEITNDNKKDILNNNKTKISEEKYEILLNSI